MSIHVKNILNENIVEFNILKDNTISCNFNIANIIISATSLYDCNHTIYEDYIKDISKIIELKNNISKDKNNLEIKDEVKENCRKFANKYKFSISEEQ